MYGIIAVGEDMVSILLVEDDTTIASSIKYYLETEGYQVTVQDTVAGATQMIKVNSYDLVLLDVTLKDGNGFDVFTSLKEIADIPVIFLTALDEEINIVHGLEMGADDYITKPFRARELLSRIKAVLRRCKSVTEEIRIGDLRINLNQAKVYKKEEIVFLTTLEYKLLLVLLENRGQVLSREQILSKIWDVSEDFVNDNTLSVYIKRLREKIEEDPLHPSIIQTVRGMGYMVGNSK